MIGHGERAEIHCGKRDGGGLAFLGVLHVDAIGGQSQLDKRAGEAGIGLDDGEKGAGGDIDAREGAAEHAEDFADEPIVLVSEKKIVGGEDGVGISSGFEEPEAKIELAGAKGEDSVVELAGHLQGPPVGAGGEDLFQRVFGDGFGGADGDGGGARFAIVVHVDKFVMKAGFVGGGFEGGESYTFRIGGASALLGEWGGARRYMLSELLGLHDFVDESPVFSALATDSVGVGAKDLGSIAGEAGVFGGGGGGGGA